MGDNRYNPNDERVGSYLTQDGQRGGQEEGSSGERGAFFGSPRGYGDHGGQGYQGQPGYQGQQGGHQGMQRDRGQGYQDRNRPPRGNFGGAGNYGGADAGYGQDRGERFSQREHHEGSGYGPYGQRGQVHSEGAYGHDRHGGDTSDRGANRGGYGYQASDYDYQDRGMMQRAGDEVRSWFGDDRAQRRRELDQRYDERDQGHDPNRGDQQGQGGNWGSGRQDESERRYAGGIGGYSRNRGPSFQDGEWIGTGSGWSRGSDEDDYGSWRRRQIESLDRDYDEYRQENRQRFHSEFDNWRSERQTQRQSLRLVQEHMEVIGSDGEHIGTVDHVLGDRILLTKSDSNADGKHHSIPSRWIQSVDERVTIRKTAREAIAAWREEADDAAR